MNTLVKLTTQEAESILKELFKDRTSFPTEIEVEIIASKLEQEAFRKHLVDCLRLAFNDKAKAEYMSLNDAHEFVDGYIKTNLPWFK